MTWRITDRASTKIQAAQDWQKELCFGEQWTLSPMPLPKQESLCLP